MNPEPDFLLRFYKLSSTLAAVGCLVVLIVSGWWAAFSFVLGFGTIALVFGLWHFHVFVLLSPGKVDLVAQILINLLRYVLLGVVVYGTVTYVHPDWNPYLLGTACAIPALLILAFKNKQDK